MKPNKIDINRLNSLDFVEANNLILQYASSHKNLSNKELLAMLHLEEKELIGSFLDNYVFFNNNHLQMIESYINENLDDKDMDFVSDLIDFATRYTLNLNYPKLIEFLGNDSEKAHFVVLSSLFYISENIKLKYIDDLLQAMENILNNPDYYQNVQILASLFLFRNTHKKKYLDEIKDWFSDSEANRIFLQNILALPYYQEEYFDRETLQTVLGLNL